MHTNQQRYAQKAFKQTSAIAEEYKKGTKEGDKYRKKYGSMAHKLPLLIRTAGLAQAFAFVQAKDETAYTDLLNHLATAVNWPNAATGEQLAAKSRSAHLDNYILLTRRVTAALIWYKRFAESVLDVKPTDDGGDDS